jgi:hypothetical protein
MGWFHLKMVCIEFRGRDYIAITIMPGAINKLLAAGVGLGWSDGYSFW